ncbi:zinc finger protein ubi-d4 B [Musca domestica]|uniref:Zinc finger protein ubi-d4 B n=2 Tax=Musca domestica TaxID=7370 RepID=A0A1I8M690_MUSDO|nr:zinc finger protein ubi-d4 B [Musca domestica]
MSAPEIEIANIGNFEKIQNFLNDSAYKEILENSENYNTRLCIERRLRMPFLDPQTGVAQTHCALFVKQKQRMPGFREGQIYTYPSSRWRKPKRQYLHNHHHSYRPYMYRETHHNHHHYSSNSGSGASRDHHQNENAALTADGNSMSASGDNDSKDSHANAEKEWFHDDMEMSYHHHEDFEDDFESDNDFDESYSARGKRKRGTAGGGGTRWRRSNAASDGTPKRGRKGGGTRRRGGANPDGEDPPRRRRGGGGSNTSSAAVAAAVAPNVAPTTISHSNSASPITNTDDSSQPGLTLPSSVNMNAPVTAPIVPPTMDNSSSNATDASMGLPTDSNSSSAAPSVPPVTTAGATAASVPTTAATATVPVTAGVSATTASPSKAAGKPKGRSNYREVAQPSPYCDFCLGDQRENKKTNLPEELVSCSDCGRSGHPSCLQFTPNMIISVKRYRWQCIECKYCSICGTSDNDDQLLFCDDCDRGYHMYCLSPPLVTPPEGSWSCKLCLEEFHKTEPAENTN